MEWIEVFDTAIKIGLGSIITGLATYLTSNSNYKRQKKQFLLEHQIKLIEKAAEHIDQYFDALTHFGGTAAGISRHLVECGLPLDQISDQYKEIIYKEDSVLINSFKLRDSAVSRIRLLRANNLERELRGCTELVNKLRDTTVHKGKLFPLEEARALNEEIREIIKSVQAEFALLYDRICS